MRLSDAEVLAIQRMRRAKRPERRDAESEYMGVESDPLAARRCAACGNAGAKTVYDGVSAAVPMTRIGGRWLCEACVPKRRPPTVAQHLFGESPDAFRLVF